MPLYEYQCEACGKRFEVIQKFSDAPIEACKHCGQGPVHKLLSSPAIQFKGSGWYITDYAKKSNTDAGKSGSPAPSDTSSAAKSDGATTSGDAGKAAAPASTSTAAKD